MKKYFLIILLFLINIDLIYAAEPKIIKEANDVIIGNNLEIRISIFNDNNIEKEFYVEEQVQQDAVFINPEKPTEIRSFDSLKTSFITWQIKVPPQQVYILSYIIKPTVIGIYYSKPTRVTEISTDITYLSSALQVMVSCNKNNICEENENNLNCPEDCKDAEKMLEKENFNLLYILIPLIIIFLILLFFILRKRR